MESFERIREPNSLDRAYEKAQKVIEDARIKETDFIEPYGVETVERDLEIIRRDEEKFSEKQDEAQEELKKIADIFEAIILDNGELNEWFGDTAFTSKTSKFDDYENHVDAVIEFRMQEPRSASFLGLAADVTFSNDTTKKFERLLKQIEKGVLPKVKYYHSDFAGIHGQLSFVPEVIIGASKKLVLEVAELWEKRQNKALATHRMQIMILHQMRDQMRILSRYARKVGQERVASLYEDRLAIIKQILDDKSAIEASSGYKTMPHDTVHDDIMNHLVEIQHKVDSMA